MYDRWSGTTNSSRDEPEDGEDGGRKSRSGACDSSTWPPTFIAISLTRRIPDLRVPVHLQQEGSTASVVRARALTAFVVEALGDMMTPDTIYERTLQATIRRYELVSRGGDPRKEALRSEGDKFLQQSSGMPGCS